VKPTTRANTVLLTAAMIWGFAFVAQRSGMEYVGPFTFNAVRFALGSLTLLIVLMFRNTKIPLSKHPFHVKGTAFPLRSGIIAGLILFCGAGLQQMGVVYTTAGKAGFITGMYVILVPIFGIFLDRRTGFSTWTGAVMALAGLYLLSITGTVHMDRGDVLVLLSAVFWAFHVLYIDSIIHAHDSICLALVQFLVCSICSSIPALLFEQHSVAAYQGATLSILYAGVMSVGIAYTLQVVGQRHAHPSHAAILLSFESLFAALGGIVMLHESMHPRALAGCALMLTGMIVSQVKKKSSG
jgi:drug/metabolite transporter (DMT)-like permease